MSDGKIKMSKPHLPPWARPGCRVSEVWQEPISSGDAAYGVGTFVRWMPPGKGAKEQEMLKWVVWESIWEGCDCSETRGNI